MEIHVSILGQDGYLLVHLVVVLHELAQQKILLTLHLWVLRG